MNDDKSLKNGGQLGIRLDPQTRARLDKFQRETLIEGVSLCRAALVAALDAYDAKGSIRLPLHISDAHSSFVGLNQEPAKYTTRTVQGTADDAALAAELQAAVAAAESLHVPTAAKAGGTRKRAARKAEQGTAR